MAYDISYPTIEEALEQDRSIAGFLPTPRERATHIEVDYEDDGIYHVYERRGAEFPLWHEEAKTREEVHAILKETEFAECSLWYAVGDV